MPRELILTPVIDAHFWVERDGKIIDWDFEKYDYIKRVNNCKGNKIYCEAPIQTQRLMIELCYRMSNEALQSNNENCAIKMKKLYEMMGFADREPDMCFGNCIIEILENGGELKFGSMGWKKKNSNDIWWEYGGETYRTLKDFIKRN